MRKELWKLLEDESLRERLVTIAAQHIKLALEHVNRQTTNQRKREITIEIAALRAERDLLINGGTCIECNKI